MREGQKHNQEVLHKCYLLSLDQLLNTISECINFNRVIFKYLDSRANWTSDTGANST